MKIHITFMGFLRAFTAHACWVRTLAGAALENLSGKHFRNMLTAQHLQGHVLKRLAQCSSNLEAAFWSSFDRCFNFLFLRKALCVLGYCRCDIENKHNLMTLSCWQVDSAIQELLIIDVLFLLLRLWYMDKCARTWGMQNVRHLDFVIVKLWLASVLGTLTCL